MQKAARSFTRSRAAGSHLLYRPSSSIVNTCSRLVCLNRKAAARSTYWVKPSLVSLLAKVKFQIVIATTSWYPIFCRTRSRAIKSTKLDPSQGTSCFRRLVMRLQSKTSPKCTLIKAKTMVDLRSSRSCRTMNQSLCLVSISKNLFATSSRMLTSHWTRRT